MYRTIAQLDTLTEQLATRFPQLCTRVQLPESSVQGRAVFAVRLRAGAEGERRGVLLIGGTHSRELMNPDALIELAVDLVVSYLNGTDIVYGGRQWTAQEIRVILESLDVWIVPCMNPDGRHHVMTVDDLWRKNRRDNPGTPCDGVDLNRNVEILWGVTEGQTSCSPCSDVYAGPSAFSEPETRNVQHLLDSHRIDCFADVHSFSELVLYPWGHAPTQTTNPAQNFTTLAGGTCAPIGRPGYQEYMAPRDVMRYQTVAQRIVDAIAAVRGRSYTPQAGIALYPTTGTHGDYVYGRHIADSARRKTYGFTFETGPSTGDVRESFHPADPTLIKRDAKSGILALVQQCICAIELIGARLLRRDAEIDSLRRVRDELLATTQPGREWIALFERVQTPLLPTVLDDERLAEETASLIELAGRLVEDEQAVVGDDDADRAIEFVRRLADRAESDQVRADLHAVEAKLGRLRGMSSREALEDLMSGG